MDGVDHVTDEQRQREELERDEQWFAGVCERSAEAVNLAEPLTGGSAIDTARIKRTVRIAVEELWLAGHVPHDVPAGLAARARRAVQEALTEAPSGAGNQGRTRGIRVWAWVGGGLAAAAVIGLAVIGSRNLTPTADSDDAAMNFATAFEEFQDDDELDQELSELRNAFSELDRIVAHGWGEDLWEEPVDEASDQTEDGA
mgnify:CR=1 FL=1|jgi:hypothetical protein